MANGIGAYSEDADGLAQVQCSLLPAETRQRGGAQAAMVGTTGLRFGLAPEMSRPAQMSQEVPHVEQRIAQPGLLEVHQRQPAIGEADQLVVVEVVVGNA